MADVARRALRRAHGARAPAPAVAERLDARRADAVAEEVRRRDARDLAPVLAVRRLQGHRAAVHVVPVGEAVARVALAGPRAPLVAEAARAEERRPHDAVEVAVEVARVEPRREELGAEADRQRRHTGVVRPAQERDLADRPPRDPLPRPRRAEGDHQAGPRRIGEPGVDVRGAVPVRGHHRRPLRTDPASFQGRSQRPEAGDVVVADHDGAHRHILPPPGFAPRGRG